MFAAIIATMVFIGAPLAEAPLERSVVVTVTDPAGESHEKTTPIPVDETLSIPVGKYSYEFDFNGGFVRDKVQLTGVVFQSKGDTRKPLISFELNMIALGDDATRTIEVRAPKGYRGPDGAKALTIRWTIKALWKAGESTIQYPVVGGVIPEKPAEQSE